MNSDMEAGPSRQPLTKQISKQPTLEFAKKVDIIPASCMENCLDYSLIVTNSVSMARDQLANERNWLTWFRLSCTLIILGKLLKFFIKYSFFFFFY
jgi:uncharacterized membrane protein YidH (DUF202 family)